MTDRIASPKISIVTPSFNQAQFLEGTINSVINQNYPQFEYIIIDGGSTDNSVEVIKKYSWQLAYWVSEPDRGQSHAINKGWAQASGEIIAWINSDDHYLPGVFRKVAAAYQKNPDAIAFIGSCVLVDREGKEIGKDIKPIPFDFLSILSGEDIPGQPAVFLSRKVLDTIGYLNEKFHYIMDWEYWIRIAEKYSPEHIVLLDESFAAFNTWDGGKTQSGICQDLIERRDFYNAFYSTKEYKSLGRIKRISFGSTYWIQGRRYLENRKYIEAIAAYLQAALFHPIKYNFFKAIYLNLDLLLSKGIQSPIKKILKKD